MKELLIKIKNNKKRIIFLVILFLILVFAIYKVVTYNDFKVELQTTKFTIGEEYTNDYKATYKGKDVTENVKVTHNIYSNTIGSYQVIFTYTVENKEYKVIKNITIVDKTAPVITLNNGNTVFIVLDDEYIEPGYTAIDDYEGDITSNVKVIGKVDTSKEGTYTLKYTVSDSSKNKTVIKRKVTVTTESPLNMNIKDFSLSGYYTNVLLDKSEEVDDEYLNNIIVIGDSAAHKYIENNILIKNQVWYIDATSIDKLFTSNIYIQGKNSNMNIIKALTEKKPSTILLTIGTNSIDMDNEYFIERYEELIKQIKENNAEINIIVQSIFPLPSSYDINSKDGNDKVNKMNYKLLELCSQYNIYFLNTSEVLKNSEGSLKSEYTNGIYLNENGNKEAINYLKNHSYKN